MRRLLGFALLFLATSLSAATDNTIRRGFNVADGGTLRLEAAVGNVRIVTGGSGVAVEVVQTARTSDRQKADELFREHDITFEQNGNDVVIRSRRDHDWLRWNDGLSVQWNIRVPDRFGVDVSTSGGDVKLDDIVGSVTLRTSGGGIEAGRVNGSVDLHTSGGGVEIRDVTGELVARTSGGSIDAGAVGGSADLRTSGGSIDLASSGGDVFARTSGGDIKIGDARGKIDAATSGGSITARFAAQPRGDSRLSTSGGDVRVTLAGTISADVDAHSSGGGIDSDVPLTVTGTQSEDKLNGTLNGGGPKIVLRTSGGGISIRRM